MGKQKIDDCIASRPLGGRMEGNMGIFDKFKKKDSAGPVYMYTENEMAQFEKYIEENFGKFDQVLHEIVSPDIHVDIIVVPPTDDVPYYKLITMGMGAYQMKVPPELKQYGLERAELVVYLPPDWNVGSGREEDYWPIRYLKVLARLPMQCDTWLGFGHTVSSDEKNSPFAENTGFCSMLLLSAVNVNYENLDFAMKGRGKINFYQMYPLYEEELDYKQNNSAEALLDLIDDEDIMPIVNINRKNYGRPS